MKYSEFEKIMSSVRMNRYLTACNGDTRKAMTIDEGRLLYGLDHVNNTLDRIDDM